MVAYAIFNKNGVKNGLHKNGLQNIMRVEFAEC